MEENIVQFGKLLAKAKNILLINHIKMDPDCFGSLTALYLVLEKMGYNVAAINDENNPKDYSFLGVDHIINPKLNISEFYPDLIISLDAASLGQLGKIYVNNKDIFDNTDFVVFDHHVTNPGFGTLNIIDPNVSSTCEILYTTLEKLGLEKYIDDKVATLLTAGIHTDTNIFYNQNTTPSTLRVAARLMELGSDFRSSMYNFYKKKEFNRTQLWGEILKDIQKTEDDKIVYAVVKDEYLEKTGTTAGDTTGINNEFLANIDNSEVCFLLYKTNDNKIKGSLRSKSVDVSSVCAELGGGGHKLAAGFSIEGTLEEVKQILLEKLKKLL